MGIGPNYTGWDRNEAGTRLDVYVRGTLVAYFDDGTNDLTLTTNGLSTTSQTFTTSQTLTDDALMGFGTGAIARMSYDTTDANANTLLLQLPAGGGTDVPVVAIGQSIESVDLGLYNGVVDPRIALFGVGAVTTATTFEFRKARGTVGTPTVVTSGDDLGNIDAFGYGGATGYVQSAAIEFDSTGTVADTRVPGVIKFRTGTDAAPTVLTTALTLDEAQLATFAGAVVTTGTTTFNGNLILPTNTDLTFTGTTGTNEVSLVTGLADALSIKIAAGADMILFDTNTPKITITPVTTITGALTLAGGLTQPTLIIDSTNLMTFQIGATDILALDDAALTFAAANDTAGQALFMQTEDGGGSATAAGAAGAAWAMETGAGSAAGGSGNSTGGAGGAYTFVTGAGAAGGTTNGVGGAGGALTLTTGAGAAGVGSGNGGAGGAIGVTSGAGVQTADSTGTSGSAGNITLTGGAGGPGPASAGGTAGDGADIVLKPGTVGAANGGAVGADGIVSIIGGINGVVLGSPSGDRPGTTVGTDWISIKSTGTAPTGTNNDQGWLFADFEGDDDELFWLSGTGGTATQLTT